MPSRASAQGQQEAAAQLWRVAGGTLPLPPALASGSPAAFWNPAQPLNSGRVTAGLDLVHAPSDVGASGFVGTLHVRSGVLGHLGFLYGRMQVADLVRTSTSPEPSGGNISYYTQVAGLTWTRRWDATILGATLGYHQHHFDLSENTGWTFDIGARQTIREVVRLAAATHLLSTSGTAAARDVYGAVGLRVWQDTPDRERKRKPSEMELRYGISVAHGFSPDHMFGVGLDMHVLAIDFMLTREGGFTEGGWRPVGGVYLELGKYRLTVARDAGLGDAGSAYRVGLEIGRHD